MRGVAALALALVMGACASLPSQESRRESTVVTDVSGTRLAGALAAGIAAHPGKSGIHPLHVPQDAFAARVLLAAAAEKSLDLQYYIWHADSTGLLLYEAVIKAAARGVRVRILLDDNNTRGLDPTIAALDAHPNVEVRLYNPILPRSLRALAFVTDFARVNRRMHNKALVADGSAAIIGGRNVGDEYFGAGDGVEFSDLDVIAVGPVVRSIAQEFDRYWNSASAYPAAAIVGAPGEGDAAMLAASFARVRSDPEARAYVDAVRSTGIVRDLLAGRLDLEWTDATLVSDDPAKTLDASDSREHLLLSSLLPALGTPARSFDLVSPYFVPGEEGSAALEALARRGVKVRVLTNSFAATDVAPVHAGYSKRRCDLLRAGVVLYELKPTASLPRVTPKAKGSGSSVGLHAKTFEVDDSRVFVGSFNFDPRSAKLNTEMGLVIDSPTLAQRLSSVFDREIPGAAYEARVAPDGACPQWIERTSAGTVVHDLEPGTSAAERAMIRALGELPIEWLL